MNKINKLLNELCPNGVEYKKIDEYSKVITKQTGFDYSKEIKPSLLSTKDDDTYPYIQTRNFCGKDFNYNTEFYIPKKIAQKYPKILLDEKCILVSIVGSIGNIGLYPGDRISFLGGAICVLKLNKTINIDYVYYCLCSPIGQKQLVKKTKGSGQSTVTIEDIRNFEIPVPPLPIQEEIVRILDNFTELTAELTAELQDRKKQYEYYRDSLLTFNNHYEKMYLGDIGKVCMCKRILKEQTASSGDVPFFKIGTFGKEPDAFISRELFNEYKSKYSYPKKGDILISCSGTIGRTVVFDGNDAYFQDSNIVWIDNDEKIVINRYLYYVYQLMPFKISTGGTIARLYNEGIEKAEICVPSLEIQERIVNVLDNFEKICNDLKIGLPAEIGLRQKQYEYYRDLLLTFPENDLGLSKQASKQAKL